MNAIIPRAISVEEYYQRMQNHFSLMDSKGFDRILYLEDTDEEKFPCHNGDMQNLDNCTIDCIALGSSCDGPSINQLQDVARYYIPTWVLEYEKRNNKKNKARYKVSNVDESDFDYLFLKDTDILLTTSNISKHSFIVNRNRKSPWQPRIYSAKYKSLLSNEKDAINFLEEVYPLEAQIGNKSFEFYLKSRSDGYNYISNMYLDESHTLGNFKYELDADFIQYNYCVFDRFNSGIKNAEITNSLIIDSTLDLVIDFGITYILSEESSVFNIEKSIITNSEIRLTNFKLDPDDCLIELNCFFVVFNNCKISTHLTSKDVVFENCIFNNCVFDFVHKPTFIDCRFTHLSNNLDIISRTFDTTKGKKTR